MDLRSWAGSEEHAMYAFEYELDKRGRRVLRGLNFAETTEFELLSAARPMNQYPDASVADDLRWLELFNRHEQERSTKSAA